MDSDLIIKNYVSFRRRNVSKLTIYSKKILIYFVFKALNKLYSERLQNKTTYSEKIMKNIGAFGWNQKRESEITSGYVKWEKDKLFLPLSLVWVWTGLCLVFCKTHMTHM